ncbi:MAG: hypothetical protein QM758_30415 [Armatimonas sp.]
MAEAGIEAAIYKLNLNSSFTGETATLYEDDAKTKAYGTYTTSLTQISSSKWRVTCVGSGPEAISRTMMAMVEKPVRILGVEAMLSNGALTVTGLANIQTIPANLHKADIVSNTSISKLGLSIVDGTLLSNGLISGLGFFPSVTGVAKVPFPDASAMATERSNWLSQAKLGGTLSSAGTLPTTITGAKYIDGNVTLDGTKQLTLDSDGTDIVYIDGDLTLSNSAVLTNKAILVVRGKVRMSGSAKYQITQGITPTPTLVVIGDGSLPTDVTAKLTNGSSTTDWGVVYVQNGNLDLTANAAMRGSWVTAGVNSTVQLPLLAFTQYFPVNYASAISISLGPKSRKIAEL